MSPQPSLRKHQLLKAASLFSALLVFPALTATTHAQNPDKCGYDELLAKTQLQVLGDKWGYSYDSLLVDLQRWSQHSSVSVSSIGKSVQNRDLWEITIADPEGLGSGRRTVYVHARTHPGEVQSLWVTRAMIEFLLSDNVVAQLLRQVARFYIVPMYNPDGVELEYPRENANGIDIESNWSSSPAQPEVVALRNRFAELMWLPEPIDVALNMHSAYTCTRYFVYHDPIGTSELYATRERNFIEAIQSHYPGGIQPWNYFVSWTAGTPLVYPESWFWINYREAVMALTYEDMNCPTAGDYEKTASAIVRGVADFLQLGTTPVALRTLHALPAVRLAQPYPNPVSLSRNASFTAVIEYELPSPQYVRLALYDLLGRQITLVSEGERPAGVSSAFVRLEQLSSGTYFYRLDSPLGAAVRPLLITR